MVETHLSHSIGDGMRNKARKILEQHNIAPITIFSSTVAAELSTGYSDPTLFDLDIVMIYKDGYYHAFNRNHAQKSYILQKSWVKPYDLSEFPDFVKGITLAGYNLERFVLPILNNHFEKLEYADHIDVLKFARDESGGRFSLFNLAYWNNCNDVSRISEFFTFHRTRMIADWFNGINKNIIARLQNETKWIGQLIYRLKKHKNLIVKNEEGKKIKIFAQDEEE